jgi:hypothetical protein
LLTSDLGQNPNNYGAGGHVIDGSRKRNLKFVSQPTSPRLKLHQGNSFKDNGQARKHKHRNNLRDKSSDQTVFQYLFSKIG